jgi:hypothetical protein
MVVCRAGGRFGCIGGDSEKSRSEFLREVRSTSPGLLMPPSSASRRAEQRYGGSGGKTALYFFPKPAISFESAEGRFSWGREVNQNLPGGARYGLEAAPKVTTPGMPLSRASSSGGEMIDGTPPRRATQREDRRLLVPGAPSGFLAGIPVDAYTSECPSRTSNSPRRRLRRILTRSCVLTSECRQRPRTPTSPRT